MFIHLTRRYMSGEIPTGEGSVFHFLDIFALGCGLEACAALFKGEYWKVLLGVAGAIALHLIGTNWPLIKTKLAPNLASFLERVGRSKRLRIAALFLVVGYFVALLWLFLYKIRHDLDEYAMPRTVTK